MSRLYISEQERQRKERFRRFLPKWLQALVIAFDGMICRVDAEAKPRERRSAEAGGERP